MYLAIVLDLFSRKVVGWSIGDRIKKELVMKALEMAIGRRKPGSGLLFHLDRGSQYCSKAFQRMLKKNGMVCSMSRRGNCWDNSVAESFFSSLKTERVFDYSYSTREEARGDIIDYIEMFYNSTRLHSYLAYLSPDMFEELITMKKAA